MPTRFHTRGRWALCAGVLVGACNGVDTWNTWTSEGGPHQQGAARVGGEVVSTVDGAPITIADVQHVVDATGLSPREALSRLQSEALLAGEAARRGYAANAEAEHVKRQAQVQELLEHEVESVTATDAEIAAELVKQSKRFHTPEKRLSLHVLAQVPIHATKAQDAAAKAFAEEACRSFSQGADPEEVMADLLARDGKPSGVMGEHLPAVANDGSFVKPFLDALFSLPSVGPVPVPVKTQYGWHAIYLTKIIAASATPEAEARATVRKEIEIRKRHAALDALVGTLRADLRVQDDAAGQQALTKLEF